MELSRSEYQRLVNDVAAAVVDKVLPLVKRRKKPEEECTWVSAEEAAELLGLSRNYLLSIKDAFTHIKMGSNRSDRVKFRRETLIEEHMHSQQFRDRRPRRRRGGSTAPDGAEI